MINPLAHIVCRDKNRLIGVDNLLPWKCKADMQYFRSVTTNKVLIVGYNTYLSISQYAGGKFSKTDPLLNERVCIVIADPTRTEYPPEQKLTHSYITRLIQQYSLESDESSKLLGFTLFVEDLKEAIYAAGIIQQCIKSVMSSKNGYGSWFIESGKPIAYVIGGSKLYEETLEKAYVSEIFETVLQMWCYIGEGINTYYYPEIDSDLYRPHLIMTKRSRVKHGNNEALVAMEVYRHKRKIGIESIQ